MNEQEQEPATHERLMVDVRRVVERHGLTAVWDWTQQNLLGLTLRVALRALAEAAPDPEDDDLGHMLERIALHLVSEAWTAPLWWLVLEQGGDPEAREAYGASLGVQTFAVELLSEYSSPAVPERIEALLQAFAEGCADTDALPVDSEIDRTLG